MNRILLLFLAADALSLLGNSLIAIVLPLLALERLGSVGAAGTVSLVTALPLVVGGLVGGLVVDRVSRRTAAITGDVSSALAVAALPLVDLVWGLDLGWFGVLGVLGALADIPAMTAREAMVPEVARLSGAGLERVTGVREGTGAAMIIIGPGVAGLALAVASPATVLWGIAAVSLVSAVCGLLLPRAVGAKPAGLRRLGGLRDALGELRAGFTVLGGDRRLLTVILFVTACAAVLACFQGIIMPVHFSRAGTPGLLGTILIAIAAGMIAGSGLYAAAGGKSRRRPWATGSLALLAAGVLVLATLASYPVILLGAVVTGAGMGVLSSVFAVVTQEAIPEHVRGRVFSVQNMFTSLACPVAVFTTGMAIDLSTLATTSLTLGLIWAVTSALAAATATFRELDERGDRP
ncbi:MFS family permease [Streptosporangium becharense]|uniref:MFS family permease n=1 Tax=Streptosporangium becharense TaxID=1816182 RepID=A0A7W9ME73_9ACTN|nr:MFS transporter [Streptosporangium becharense]MBB2915359.1 MFS family permease [Streptosporangium becharense]MBB5816943.1 MFS family permease [Streptosporangium becharense]